MSAVLLSYLRRHYLPTTSDAELIRRYCATRDHAAFQTIVERYGPMVLGACRRRLGDADADDAFQAVFLLLSRQCHKIRKPGALPAWLHGAAMRVRAKSFRSNCRRTGRENQPQHRVGSTPLESMTARELLDAIDDEVARLPDRDKRPLLLVYWQGRTQAEAASELQITRGAVAGRLDRARKRLCDRLRRRGFGDGELQTMLIAPIGIAAISGDLLASACALIAPNASIPTSIAALTASGGIAKFTAATAVAMIMASVGLMAYGATARENNDKPPPSVANAESKTLRVIVLGPDGKPVPGVNVHHSIWTDDKLFRANRDRDTDASGVADFELPKATITILRLWAEKKPFVPIFANWEQEELAQGAIVPAEFTFHLEKGVAAGGRIVDANGKPIAGAQVNVRMNNLPVPGGGRTKYSTWIANGRDAATTDADGHWHIDCVPKVAGVELSLLVKHPSFVSDDMWGQSQRAAGITSAMMLNESATQTLKSGIFVRGRVTDPDGKPIEKAIVVYGDRAYAPSSPRDFPIDADGRFSLPALLAQDTKLTVIANGFAPQLRQITIKDDMLPQDFQMRLGKSIQILVVNDQGKPLPGVGVVIDGWRGCKSLYNQRFDEMHSTSIPTGADKNGVWNWTWAPDEPVKLRIGSGGMTPQEIEIAGGEPIRTVIVKSEHRIVGHVIDAETGQPIPDFIVYPIDVFGKGWLHAERHNAEKGKNGRFEFLVYRNDIPLRLRVEAEGYRTQTGPEFRLGDDSPRVLTYRMQRSNPISGMVLDAEGRPAANAKVLMATPTEEVKLADHQESHFATSDANGRFSFPDPGEPYVVRALRDGAFSASVERGIDQHDAGALQLQPAASVRGQLLDGGKPIAGATVFLAPIRLDNNDRPKFDDKLETVTTPEGRFEFRGVPPGTSNVRTLLGPWKEEDHRCGPSLPLELRSGQQVEVLFGTGGCAVTGKVKLTGTVPSDLDCTYSLNYLVSRSPKISPLPELTALGFDNRNGWRDSWRKSTEGMTYLSTLQHWFVKLAPDGSFRISGVPAGEYDLAVEVYAKPSGCLVDPLAHKVVHVSVTEADVAQGQLTLPDVEAEVAPTPAIGDTPSLSFRRSDGNAESLADVRGRHTVVHFWASWCVPCKKQLPTLRQLHERYGQRINLLSLTLDEDAAAWKAAMTNGDMRWPQGQLTTGALSIPSVPTYWLLDATGKIVAKIYDADELSAALATQLK